MNKLNPQQQKAYDEWFAAMPPNVQDLINEYPPGDYKIKGGAPYGVSCPGTIVTLFSYFESGDVSVVVLPENLLPPAIEHIKYLHKKFKGDAPFLLPTKPHKVDIDPIWLEPIS